MRKKLLAALLVAALLLAALTPLALADSLYAMVSTPASDGRVNLRSAAGVTKSIVGLANNGDALEILYKGNTWHKVKVLRTGRVGWMYYGYIKMLSSSSGGGGSTSSGVKPSELGIGGNVGRVVTKYSSSTVNLRWGPGTGYGVITSVKRNVRFEILSESGNWYDVRLRDGTTGYISKNYAGNGLPANTTAKLNMRYGPSTAYDIMTTLSSGKSLTILWIGDKWCQVEADGRIGYVSNNYVRVQ